MSLQQPDIEAGYFSLPEQEIFLRIEERKKELAGRLLILCHHYQQESLFRFADLKGDSLKLAREAASVHDREFIIFCGVHFMAESADILARPHQKVMLPHLHAGCPMADMATVGAVSMAYRDLVQAGVVQDELSVVPVTYVNSSAAVKAFVGEREGSVCTSSNAERVLAWALAKGDKVFSFLMNTWAETQRWPLAYQQRRFLSGIGGSSWVEAVWSSYGVPGSCSGMDIVKSICAFCPITYADGAFLSPTSRLLFIPSAQVMLFR